MFAQKAPKPAVPPPPAPAPSATKNPATLATQTAPSPAAKEKTPPAKAIAAKSTFTQNEFEKARIEETQNGHETVEVIDLDGDGLPEIRRIFFSKPAENSTQKVIVRKEIDMDGDGKYDIVRLYDKGQLSKIFIDFDQDGSTDIVLNYRYDMQTGQDILISKEYDFQGNGRANVRKYYVNGELFKKETARNNDGFPDQFDYFVQGRLVQTEFDDNHDGIVDRWGTTENEGRFTYLKEAQAAAKVKKALSQRNAEPEATRLPSTSNSEVPVAVKKKSIERKASAKNPQRRTKRK